MVDVCGNQILHCLIIQNIHLKIVFPAIEDLFYHHRKVCDFLFLHKNAMEMIDVRQQFTAFQCFPRGPNKDIACSGCYCQQTKQAEPFFPSKPPKQRCHQYQKRKQTGQNMISVAQRIQIYAAKHAVNQNQHSCLSFFLPAIVYRIYYPHGHSQQKSQTGKQIFSVFRHIFPHGQTAGKCGNPPYTHIPEIIETICSQKIKQHQKTGKGRSQQTEY